MSGRKETVADINDRLDARRGERPTRSTAAARLLAEKRVTPMGVARVFMVCADTGTTRVTLADSGWTHCTCPANRLECACVEAARILAAQLRAEGVDGAALEGATS